MIIYVCSLILTVKQQLAECPFVAWNIANIFKIEGTVFLRILALLTTTAVESKCHGHTY